MPTPIPSLTDDEGAFISLLLRMEPATAYQLAKIYSKSPVSNFGTSTGKIYPLTHRLVAKGLLEVRPVPGDSRGSEHLLCTPLGKEAMRLWLMEMRPQHVLLDDPMRTKLQSFDLLSKDQQVEWIAGAKAALHAKLEELEAYARTVTVPFKELVHDNAVSSVRCRLDWLDRLLISIVQGSASD